MIKFKPIIPSSILEQRKPSDMNFNKKITQDWGLHLGVVLEVVEIDDDKNQSKLGEEYRVMVIGQDARRGQNTTIYKNCLAADGFGGIADFFQFRRRVPKKSKEVQLNASLKNQTGSIVLLLALDGNGEKGIIIGALAHPSKKSVLSKELETHMEGEFNGINFQVNKDGELTITFNSPSNINKDGVVEYSDAEASEEEKIGGTYVKMEKDGSVEINDGKTEKIRIDKTNKSINMESEELHEVKTGQVDITATKGVKATITENLVIEAEGSAALKFLKEYKLEATDKAIVESKEIFLTVEQKLHLGGAGGNPAVIQSTVYQGVGNLGFPVICNAIGPYSSKVNIVD